MATRSSEQIRRKSEMARAVMKHHFGKTPKRIIHKTAGHTNFVFEAKMIEGDFIVRISSSAYKIQDFIKEQWAVNHVREKDVPVADILEVGNEAIPFPYMIQRKLAGQEPVHHPDRLKIINQMGKYAAIINSIPTNDFGQVFDWSENKLSKNATWKEYLDNEICVPQRLDIIARNNMLTKANHKILMTHLNKIENWKNKPSLNHGDIRLKNVIINEKSKIIAIIDWEDCSSNIAPYWELSIALHDLSIDDKQAFIEGYGLSAEEYSKQAFAVKTLNIINYAPKIERLAAIKDKKTLELYRLRLNGYFDMFSL